MLEYLYCQIAKAGNKKSPTVEVGLWGIEKQKNSLKITNIFSFVTLQFVLEILRFVP